MDCYKHPKTPMVKVREWSENGTRWREWRCSLCQPPLDLALERVLFYTSPPQP